MTTAIVIYISSYPYTCYIRKVLAGIVGIETYLDCIVTGASGSVTQLSVIIIAPAPYCTVIFEGTCVTSCPGMNRDNVC